MNIVFTKFTVELIVRSRLKGSFVILVLPQDLLVLPCWEMYPVLECDLLVGILPGYVVPMGLSKTD